MHDPLQAFHLIVVLQRAAIAVLFGGFVLMFAAEMLFPRFGEDGPLKRLAHGGSNLVIWIIGIVLMSLVYGTSVALILNWLQLHGVGVLNQIPMPASLSAVLAFLAFDATDYFFHRLSHNTRWLWLMHAVHHSDRQLDVTTNLRQHPLHIVATQLWKLVACAAIGVPVWIFFVHEIVNIGVAHCHHAAIRWPRWIDRAFSWLLVTPRMHWNHHSPDMPRTNSNYGVILSIWDRLFKTYTPPATETTATFGLDALDEAHWHSAWGMLATPWRARRLPRL